MNVISVAELCTCQKGRKGTHAITDGRKQDVVHPHDRTPFGSEKGALLIQDGRMDPTPCEVREVSPKGP